MSVGRLLRIPQYIATVQSRSAGLKMYNIIVKNTRGKGVQALALSAYADKQGRIVSQVDIVGRPFF